MTGPATVKPGPTIPALAPSQIQPWLIPWQSLAGTLQGTTDILGLGQAQQEADLAKIHEQVMAQQQQAQQAGQQYLQAAQQPPPDMSNVWDQLLGNVASVISRNPEFGQQAQKRGESQQRELMQARHDNLAALQESYQQQYTAARQLGNSEAEAQLRMKTDQTMRARLQLMQQMMQADAKTFQEQQSQAGRMELEGLRGEMQQLVAQIRASQGAEVDEETAAVFEHARNKTDAGDFIDSSKFKGVKDNRALNRWAASNKVTVLDSKQAGALTAAEIAYRNLTDQAFQVRDLLAEGPMDRPLVSARNWAMKMSGAEPRIGAFDSMWSNAIQALKAYSLQGGGPSLMRINKAEIDKALLYDRPNLIWDTKPILDQKMKNFEIMRRNGGNAILQKDWRTLPAIGKARWKVMRPDGVVIEAPGGEAARLVREEGYARVLDDDPRLSGSEPTPPGPQGPTGVPPPGTPMGSQRTFGKTMKAIRKREAGGQGDENTPAYEEWDDTGDVPKVIE